VVGPSVCGDSGSLVLEDRSANGQLHRPLGHHFGGGGMTINGQEWQIGVAKKIGEVVKLFGGLRF
jgi:hypothetical protein